MEYPSVSYDYTLNIRSSIGIEISYNLDFSAQTNYFIAVNYHRYTGKKRARGFFFEGNNGYRHEINRPQHQFNEGPEDTYGPGFGFGGKWGLSKNLIGSTYIRLYKDLIETESFSFDGSLGISISYRF